jgi:hypothetical protein
MTIKFDIPFEVTEKQYNDLLNKCAGIVAGQKRDGKFYIKVWLMNYAGYVRTFLTN